MWSFPKTANSIIPHFYSHLSLSDSLGAYVMNTIYALLDTKMYSYICQVEKHYSKCDTIAHNTHWKFCFFFFWKECVCNCDCDKARTTKNIFMVHTHTLTEVCFFRSFIFLGICNSESSTAHRFNGNQTKLNKH